MKTIDREAYLAYALDFKPKERELLVDFAQWLPSNIIDCHAHCNLAEHVRWVDDTTYNHMLSTFPSFSLEESEQWRSILYPNSNVRSLRFPKTFSGIDHKQANRYLFENSNPSDRIALYGLPDDITYTVASLRHPRISALKMYHSYTQPPATEIYQYFPKEILKVAENLDIPIILHPPLIITKCLDQVIQLLADFPQLRIVLAHLGLTKTVVPGLEEAYSRLAQYKRIFLDTALVPSEEVVSLAIGIFGAERIMYGSDEPLNLVRSAAYTHPTKGQRLITEYQYHWVDDNEHRQYQHLATGVTHAHWQSLHAIKGALSGLPFSIQESAKQKIFHDNAYAFFGF